MKILIYINNIFNDQTINKYAVAMFSYLIIRYTVLIFLKKGNS